MALKVVRRARQQAASFPRIHRLRAGSEIDPTAQTNLDEYDRRPVVHDEIDLAVSTAIVAGYEPQTAVTEISGCERLALPAPLGGDPGAADHYWRELRPSVSTRGTPRVNRAHVSRLSIVFLSLSESVPVAPYISAYC